MSRRLPRILLAVTALAILGMTLWPNPQDGDGTPIARAIVDWMYTAGLPTAITFEAIEFTANIVMFVPFGLFLALSLPRWMWPWAIVLGLAFTLLIEFLQAAFLPERFPTVSDLIANTAGALIGGALSLIGRRRSRRAAIV
ncbi:VanZ family protein [Labedella endophytica]|uniref:VanZ family protein n=1 Tax=Labedella endophytica TaxID=1523160 RepID=A0A3S0Y0K6_9MICO|nr:VanZ family protein [Labedella endophytica]RUR01433.1 VanZ family protein [Labedella endophytica]